MPERDNNSVSDRSLLRRFRRGEQDAATKIYLRYANRLHRLAAKQTGRDLQSRVDPDDIVQSVFRTFFRRAKAGHYDVPDGDELWKLFLVIGLHKVRDVATFHRAARRDIGRTAALHSDGAAADLSESGRDAEQTLRLVIDELLDGLEPVQRDIILKRLDGGQVADIARETDRARRTVERTLQKFRAMLRSTIDEDRAK